MLKIKQFSSKGIKKEEVFLPKTVEEKENLNLLAQANRIYEWNEHPGLSKAKTRSEVKKTTRKVYRQKGTGRARHGARSAPIFVGGGVAHGPKGIKKTLTFSKNMARKALNGAISLKVKSGDLIVISQLSSVQKTKEGEDLLKKIFKSLGKKVANSLIIFDKESKIATKAFKNIKNVTTDTFQNLNSRKILNSDLIVFDQKIFEVKKEKKEK